ncbi:Uma2 family endonuclease [Streptomyces olivochromogenes]|uniref:Uma2 family endonuclease n=1 Tax=Streptomyces olivochromogenes TaxID=1963 RepID=UPI001F45CCBA|nr:Uma2 family endonuclease [Streptomyces olivochromogenes]MCF3132852.1 Uma2 family endonuclease [Streptomyces olivochromogenes]
MADETVKCLDDWFDRLDRLPVPEGYKVEIVGGTVYMAPQRDIHWETIRRILRALEDHFGRHGTQHFSDVRIDFPGHQNGFCPDVVKLRDGATKDEEDRWRYEDVEFVAEISAGTAQNDYGPKRKAYALAAVPVYLVADPYQGKCHMYTEPKDGDYTCELRVDCGTAIDLTTTPPGLTLKTDAFPRG